MKSRRSESGEELAAPPHLGGVLDVGRRAALVHEVAPRAHVARGADRGVAHADGALLGAEGAGEDLHVGEAAQVAAQHLRHGRHGLHGVDAAFGARDAGQGPGVVAEVGADVDRRSRPAARGAAGGRRIPSPRCGGRAPAHDRGRTHGSPCAGSPERERAVEDFADRTHHGRQSFVRWRSCVPWLRWPPRRCGAPRPGMRRARISSCSSPRRPAPRRRRGCRWFRVRWSIRVRDRGRCAPRRPGAGSFRGSSA